MYKTKEIKKFIERIKDISNAEQRYMYDYQSYDCEVADLFKAQLEQNIDLCLNFYRNQENNKYFEIAHPIHNEIKTRVVASVGEWQSVTFLIDENNKYPWLFISDRCAIDYIITLDKIYTFPFAGLASILNLENWIYEAIKDQELFFCDITWGFRFCDRWPWHDFYECKANFLALDTNKNIKDKDNSFFIPRRYMKKKSTHEVYLRAKGLPVYIYHHKETPWHFIHMGKQMLQEVIEHQDRLVDNDECNLIIWLSLTSTNWGKRWIEQVEGSASIIIELLKYFPKIKVYFDGLCSYETNKNIPVDAKSSEIEISLKQKLNIFIDSNKILFHSLDGLNFKEKISFCISSDVAIAEPGSAAIIPSLICQKPCIFYGNFTYLEQVSVANPVAISRCILKEFLLEDHSMPPLNNWSGNYPYHIAWQHLFNLIVEVLKEIKDVKMYKLEVPPVELVAKQYKLEQELGIKLLIENVALYDKLEQRIDNLISHNDNNLTKILDYNTDNILNFNLQIKNQIILNFENKIKEMEFKLKFGSAKQRIQNHLSYKLGSALIENSKSI
ncbi:hypothetical protein PAJ06_08640, partial [Campylobacter coli]|nr:hypothetical protein [Campylobacter coli]